MYGKKRTFEINPAHDPFRIAHPIEMQPSRQVVCIAAIVYQRDALSVNNTNTERHMVSLTSPRIVAVYEFPPCLELFPREQLPVASSDSRFARAFAINHAILASHSSPGSPRLVWFASGGILGYIHCRRE